jgi:hypothetical protein
VIRHSAPPIPAGFPPAKIKAAIDALEQSDGAATVEEHWRDYKNTFRSAQHNKCGWCEVIDTSSHGAIDHYAPKGAVASIAAVGHETENVSGRRHEPGIQHNPGYWWRAFDWDNWIYACTVCNSTWKHIFFPVQEDPHPKPDGKQRKNYTPLLLHPLVPDPAPDPEDHLDYDDGGQIRERAGSLRGRATINTLLLDRESLRSARKQVADNVIAWCRFALLSRDRNEALYQLHKLGLPSHPFAGLVRSLIRQKLRVSWDKLHHRFGAQGQGSAP